MTERTYSRETIDRANAAWSQYGRRWDPIRRACSSWSLFPPAGSTWDQWDDAHPSQAAIVGRFFDGNPGELVGIVKACDSWHRVVAEIILAEQQLEEQAIERERIAILSKHRYPTTTQAIAIAERLGRQLASR